MNTEQMTQEAKEIVSTLKNSSIETIALGLLLLVGGIIAIKLIMRLLEKALQGMKKQNGTVYRLLHSSIKTVLYFIVIMVAASSVGIPMTSLLALFSIAGLAISLAVQGALSSLAGGIIILMGKPFVSGDFIETDNICGTVKEVGFFHTKLDDPEGRRIILPNGSLYTSRVINYTVSGRRRIELSIGASYDNTPAEVRKAALEAVDRIGITEGPIAPEVVLERYRDNDIEYRVYVWVKADDFRTMKYRLNEEIYSAFAANGVQMSYPHVNVHFDKGAQANEI